MIMDGANSQTRFLISSFRTPDTYSFAKLECALNVCLGIFQFNDEQKSSPFAVSVKNAS